MVDFLVDKYDVLVSESTISRVLQKEKISRKKVSFRWVVLLLILATTPGQRTVPIPQNRVVCTFDRMELWTVDLHRWISRAWEDIGSQIWMVTRRQTRTDVSAVQALKEMEYTPCLHLRWLHRLGDYPRFIQRRIICQIPRKPCYSSYNPI